MKIKKFNESLEDKIPTVEEFWMNKTGNTPNQEEFTAMIEFARMHVDAALKAASKPYSSPYNGGNKVNRDQHDIDAILKSYPLENIK